MERKIDHRLMQIEDARNSELNRICIQKSPTKRVVFIKASLRPRSYLDLEYSIRQLEAGQTEPLYYEKLLREIEKEKLEITGFSREITLIDYGITGDTDKFVTEIQIPVK